MNARTTDPLTSKIAAEPNALRETIATRLLLAFCRRPKSGMTAEQAAHLAGLSRTGYWKRVSDLIRDGLIVPLLTKDPSTGQWDLYTEVGSSGKPVRVYVPTIRGKEQARVIRAQMKKGRR